MAAATQQAPQQQAPQNQARKSERPPLMGALQGLSRTAGIAILAVLLVVSLFVGNFRALAGATPKDFLRQGDVQSIIEDRLAAANNALTVAERAQLDETYYEGVKSAITAMEEADTAREISRTDQALTAAVSQMVVEATDQLDSENRTMLQRAADNFAEQGSFLRQEARSYNEKALKAEELYEKLPTRFVLAQPDVYEGL